MSLTTLLVLASMLAALAFFVAGYLLRGPGARARAIPATDAGAEARAESSSQKVAQAREAEAARAVAERELVAARAECERLAAKERILADRLRSAEDKNRAAFEQEERSAAAFAAQLEATKADHQRRDESSRGEVERLRAEAAAREVEQARLTELAVEQENRASLAERALLDLRAHSQVEREQWMQESQREREQQRQALALAEERAHKAEARLAESAAQADQNVAALTGELQAAQAVARAERERLESELRQREAGHEQERSERQRLAVALRAAEEARERERSQAEDAAEKLDTAAARRAEWERLAQENAELREQQAAAAAAAVQLAGAEAEARDAKVQLTAAQAKLVEMASTLEENRRLREEVTELNQHREASAELERLTIAHKQVRLDAELMARRLQELVRDQAELVPLRAQAAETASLAEEVAYLRRRERDLEAQLYASGLRISQEMAAVSAETQVQTPMSDMETNLDSLVGEGGPRTAVLADAQGFLIASAGRSEAEEGLAAFAAVAGEMVARARMLLPLAEVDSVRVVDRNRMVLTCRLFESAGEGLGLSTLGPGEPAPENTARAVGELAAIVSGAEPRGPGDPEPAT